MVNVMPLMMENIVYHETDAKRGLGPDQAVETGIDDLEVEKDIKNARGLAARVQKREKTKLTGNRKSEKEKESEKDQKVAHHTVLHLVKVEVVALITKRRTRTVNVSAGLAVGALKREERRGHALRRETEIATEIKKDVQGVETDQVLLVQDQEVKVLIKSN